MLQDTNVFYQNQPIGVVVADTFERAAYAASLVRVKYDAHNAAHGAGAKRRRMPTSRKAEPGRRPIRSAAIPARA